MATNYINEQKRALLARKEKLLQDIQYYEKRIADFHVDNRTTSIFEDNSSSDSETDLPIAHNGPSATQLKIQQSRLKTSLQATQELTNLHVLQSEVNVMVQDPIIIDEPPVLSTGCWREVIAECRLDLVPFTMSFHIHNPSTKFGGPSYRNLKVSLVKAAHQTELTQSVLTHTRTPSEAVEVLRSYSVAHRSRRSTLAHLAEKYHNLLFMEPIPEGGYVLKCADLLEVRWTLQNKWSPIAPFHHRLRFDLEYMDESYIKIITQYHRQLSDPAVETDERTALLSKIINTCLDAKGPTQELYESMESDPENAQTLRKRRTTLDQEVIDTAVKRKRDDNIMAPPKSLPKKSKAKGKENVDKVNEMLERQSVNKDGIDNSVARKESVVSTKSKIIKDATVKENVKITKDSDSRKDSVAKSTKGDDGIKESIAKSTKDIDSRKDNVVKSTRKDVVKENMITTKVINSRKDGVATSTKDIESRKESIAKSTKDTDGRKEIAKSTKQNAAKRETNAARDNILDKNTNDGNIGDVNAKPKVITKDVHKSKVTSGVKSSQSNDNANLKDSNVKKNNSPDKDDNSNDINVAKISKNVEQNLPKVTKKEVITKEKNITNKEMTQKDKFAGNNKESRAKANTNLDKNVDDNNIRNDAKNAPKKNKKNDDISNVPVKKSKIDKSSQDPKNLNAKKSINANKLQNNANNVPKNLKNKTEKADTKDSTFTKSRPTIKKVTESNEIISTKTYLADVNDKNNAKSNDNTKNSNVNPKIVQNKAKTVKSNNKIDNIKNLNNYKLNQQLKVPGDTNVDRAKRLSAGSKIRDISTESKISKIPQKLTKVVNALKKNPLRISPRKLSSNMKSAGIAKTIQKPITSIPRLLKKPVVKSK